VHGLPTQSFLGHVTRGRIVQRHEESEETEVVASFVTGDARYGHAEVSTEASTEASSELATSTNATAGALHDRGVTEPAARLTTEAGTAVFHVAFERRVTDDNQRERRDFVVEPQRNDESSAPNDAQRLGHGCRDVVSARQHPIGPRKVARVPFGVTLEVVLVLGFGLPERSRWRDFGHHATRPQTRRVNVGDGVERDATLFVIDVEDGGSITRPTVITLSIHRGRIVNLEEELQYVAI
jgi:hypothetical protein